MAYPKDYCPAPLQPTPRDFPRPASINPPRPMSSAAMRVKLVAQAFSASEISTIHIALVWAMPTWRDEERNQEASRLMGIFDAALRYYEIQRERDRERYATPTGRIPSKPAYQNIPVHTVEGDHLRRAFTEQDRAFIEEPLTPADMVDQELPCPNECVSGCHLCSPET